MAELGVVRRRSHSLKMNGIKAILFCLPLVVFTGCQNRAVESRGLPLGLTKQQVVRRVGFPAGISLALHRRATVEIWQYYWGDTDGVQVADLVFRNGIFTSALVGFDASKILSTDKPADLALIRSQVDRGSAHHSQ